MLVGVVGVQRETEVNGSEFQSSGRRRRSYGSEWKVRVSIEYTVVLEDEWISEGVCGLLCDYRNNGRKEDNGLWWNGLSDQTSSIIKILVRRDVWVV